MKITSKGYHVPPNKWMDINCDKRLSDGDILGIYGTNGSGKTTLLKALLNDVRSNAGELVQTSRDEVSYKPQRLIELMPPWLSGQRMLDTFSAGGSVAHHEHFISDERRAVPCGNLSGGQRQLLALQIVLSTPHTVLFLDEPFAGLDTQKTHDIIVHIKEHCRNNGVIAFIIVHEPPTLQYISDWFIFVNGADRAVYVESNQISLSEHQLRSFDIDSRAYKYCQSKIT